MILRALLVDDEAPALRVLRKFCEATPNIQVEGMAMNAEQADAWLSENRADLLFLDVHMPGQSGLQWVRSLSDPPKVILTTAFPEYAVQGFDMAAVDYLLKPFSLDRFQLACQRARKQILEEREKDPPVCIRADRKEHLIPVNELYFVQAYGDYLKVHTDSGVLLPKMRLYQLEADLPKSFFLRVHRSWLINTRKVEHFTGHEVVIDGVHIPVSERFRAGLEAKVAEMKQGDQK